MCHLQHSFHSLAHIARVHQPRKNCHVRAQRMPNLTDNHVASWSYTLIMLTPEPMLTRRYGNKSSRSICTNCFWPSKCVKASCLIACTKICHICHLLRLHNRKSRRSKTTYCHEQPGLPGMCNLVISEVWCTLNKKFAPDTRHAISSSLSMVIPSCSLKMSAYLKAPPPVALADEFE